MKSKLCESSLIAEMYATINPDMVADMVAAGAGCSAEPEAHEQEGQDAPDESEMHMAKAELHKLSEYSIKLSELLDNTESLEGWTASKITKAADYISSVYHWLDYEQNGKMEVDGTDCMPPSINMHPAEDER